MTIAPLSSSPLDLREDSPGPGGGSVVVLPHWWDPAPHLQVSPTVSTLHPCDSPGPGGGSVVVLPHWWDPAPHLQVRR